MIKRNFTASHLWIIGILAILTSAGAFYAAINTFPFVFIIPIIFLVIIFAIYKTEKFILLSGALAPLSINVSDIGGGMGLSLPTEPLYILAFIFIVLYFIKDFSISFSFLKHPLAIAVLLYLIWLWVSSFFSTMPLVSIKFSIARTLYIVLFFITSTFIFKRIKNIGFFLNAFAISTLLLVIYTLGKHASEGFLRSSSYGISWPFFPDHGMYAAAIAFSVTILAFYTFSGRAFRFHYVWLPIAGFFLVVLLFGIVVSYTRATWLSLIAAMGVALLLYFRVKFHWIVIALFSITTYAVVNQDAIMYKLEANKQGSSDELEGHVKSVSNISTDPSNLERINRWKCAGRMVSQKPIFGFGPGTYVFKYGTFQKSSELTIISTNSGDLGDAHSEYFSAMSETGYTGMALWIAITLITIATGFKIIYKTKIRQVRITALIVLLGLVTYYFHALLNNYSQYDKIAVPFWSFTAIILALDIFYLKKENTV